MIIEHEDLLRCPMLESPNYGDWFCSNHFLLKSRCTATCSANYLLTVQLIDNSFDNRQVINDNSEGYQAFSVKSNKTIFNKKIKYSEYYIQF